MIYFLTNFHFANWRQDIYVNEKTQPDFKSIRISPKSPGTFPGKIRIPAYKNWPTNAHILLVKDWPGSSLNGLDFPSLFLRKGHYSYCGTKFRTCIEMHLISVAMIAFECIHCELTSERMRQRQRIHFSRCIWRWFVCRVTEITSHTCHFVINNL